MSFTSCISIPFISRSLHIHPLPLQPHKNKVKFKREKEKEKRKEEGKKSLVMEAGVWHSESRKPFYPNIYLQVFIAEIHWSPSKALVSTTPLMLGFCWDSSWISCCFPVPAPMPVAPKLAKLQVCFKPP